jgi:hypothetical protein
MEVEAVKRERRLGITISKNQITIDINIEEKILLSHYGNEL